MKFQFAKLKLALVALIVFSVAVGGFHVYRTWAGSEQDYKIVYQSPPTRLAPGEKTGISVIVQNVSPETWDKNILRLGTVYSIGDADRSSVWVTDGWLSDTRVELDSRGDILPLRRAEFHFQVQAPEQPGLYKEYFKPVLEHVRWLSGEPIILTFRIGEVSDVTIQEVRDKEILINRATQTGEMLESGFVVASLPISTGRSGYTTPAGTYKIGNHIKNAYSNEYELWMPNWLGLASLKYGFRGYGMHGLPYWRVNPARFEEGKIYPGGRLYTDGKLYEGYEHLGIPMSHGCIRFGVRESEVLYDWADNGTLVTVV